MKVICAGVFKSGTKSINAALSELGYEVYDVLESYHCHYKAWQKIRYEGWDVDDFRTMYRDVDAVCDAPANYFWEEILEAFPDAKVILTVRDSDGDWYRSMENQLKKFDGWHNVYFSFLSRTYVKFHRFCVEVAMVLFGPVRSFRVLSARYAAPEMPFRQCYRRHNAHVINMCPKKNLLVYNCKEGWEPLCRFLDKPVPQKAFPRKNVGGQMHLIMRKFPVFDVINRELNTSHFLLAVLGCVILTRFTPFGRSMYKETCNVIAGIAGSLQRQDGSGGSS